MGWHRFAYVNNFVYGFFGGLEFQRRSKSHYLRFRLGIPVTSALSDEAITAMEEALQAANEWAITPHAWSVRLEAGILARRPLGEVVPNDGGMSRLGQIVYERLFFDVRKTLDDPRQRATIVCSDPGRLMKRGMWDFTGKGIAYSLGFGEFERWRLGSPSRAARAAARDIEYVHLYLDGLRLLGLYRHEDVSSVLGGRFEAIASWNTAAGEGAKVAPWAFRATYTAAQIEELMVLIPGK